MNIDNINKTIETIKFNQSLAFYMGDWITSQSDFISEQNECGTACCLAGYAAITEYGSSDNVPHNDSYEDDIGTVPYTDYFKLGADYFGIDMKTAVELFAPNGGHISETDKEIGIRVLEHLRDTGEVLWPKLPSKRM